MEDIKENEYIRTTDGFIDKLIIGYNGKCNNSNCNKKHISCKNNYYEEKDIIKHSKNLIDLIEVEDYVNGYKVIDKLYEKDLPKIIKCLNDNSFKNVKIKDIVTKERFDSIKYIVEE